MRIFSEITNKIGYLSSAGFVHRWPFFYGWMIMAAGVLGLIMTGPGQTYTVSIFIEHFIDDLGISRSAISTLYSLGTLAGSLALPWWGRQIDRKGSRKLVVLIALLFGLACIYLGWVHNALMLGIGFVAIRMLGSGSLGLVSQTVINQWWSRRRGMIMGVAGFILAILGMGMFPNLVHFLIGAFGWRLSYTILGVLLILIMAPVGYIFFRNRPEDYGLKPDNASSENDAQAASLLLEKSDTPDWTLAEAFRTQAFWILLAGGASFGMIATGQFFHMVGIFEDRGLPPSVAAAAFIPISLAMAAANLGGGFAIDRIPAKFLLALAMFFQALSLLLLQWIESTASAYLFGVLLGITGGLSQAIGSVVWPHFYGRRYLGSIYGFTTAASIFGAAFGPLPFGLARDLLGTYAPTLYAFAILSFFLAALALFIQKPARRS